MIGHIKSGQYQKNFARAILKKYCPSCHKAGIHDFILATKSSVWIMICNLWQTFRVNLKIGKCLNNIRLWMRSSILILDDDKTEVINFFSRLKRTTNNLLHWGLVDRISLHLNVLDHFLCKRVMFQHIQSRLKNFIFAQYRIVNLLDNACIHTLSLQDLIIVIVFHMIVHLMKIKNYNQYKMPPLDLLPIVRNMIIITPIL